MTGRIDIFIPRTAAGELMTGPVPKHRLPKVRGIDVRTYFDPLADRNMQNAIAAPKAKPMPAYAPRGWRLRPVDEVGRVPETPEYLCVDTTGHPLYEGRECASCLPEVAPSLELKPEPVGCPRCGRTFRKSGVGLAWHLANAPDCGTGKAA